MICGTFKIKLINIFWKFKDKRVFLKWISLNHDKIQKWYGFQKYYLSGNKYITNGSNIKCIFTTSG